MFRAGLLALALLSAGPVQADPAYDACADKAASNVDFSDCGSAWIEREEVRLNALCQRLLPFLPAASKRDMLTEQRAWVSYKNKSCLWRANGDWGREGQVILYPTCRAKVIGDRADYFMLIEKDMEDH